MELRQLPTEILDLIINQIASPSSTTIALPASDIVPKTLHSCLLACKATHATSLELLYRRCLYIDSAWRLRALVRSYKPQTAIYGRSTTDPSVLRRNWSTSLFLKPFSADTIDERNVVTSIAQLFTQLSESLQKLVIDMPLRSYYPDEPGAQNLRSLLRQAFLSLHAIEEFVTVRDELYLPTMIPRDFSIEPPVWTHWTGLRRLALYNLALDEELDPFINAMPNLQTLILTRPDTGDELDERSREWNANIHIVVVNTWRDHWGLYRPGFSSQQPSAAQPFGLTGDATIHRVTRPLILGPPAPKKPLPIIDSICVDGRNPVKEARGTQRRRFRSQFDRSASRNWAAYDLRYTFNDPRVCQDWVKESALDGSLWPEGEIGVAE